jgi:O-antigen ligase
VLTLASIFIGYYVLYLMRLFIKAFTDTSPSTQEVIRILYSGFEASHLNRKACRVYLPILLGRSLLFSIFLVVFSANPMIQAVSCLAVVIVWDIYSFMACPYHFYVRVFLRIH